VSESGKAVFLSYASQDADAARRIAQALRAEGIEVWFDESALAGGEAWDASIRRQIRDCALFVAIVSAHTQARKEGYFRLEWKLADERSQLIAEGTPFVLPVIIDGTKERDALVPKSFLGVQWTWLPHGEVPPGFVARVRKLLGAPAPPAPRPDAMAQPPQVSGPAGAPFRDTRSPLRPSWLRLLPSGPTLARGMAIASAASLLTAAAAWLWFRPVPGTEQPVTRLTAPIAPFHIDDIMSDLALSADGKLLAFVGTDVESARGIYVRRLDSYEVVRVTETGTGPFFSPDNKWVAFWDNDQKKLKKVGATGGPAIDLCTSKDGHGTWAPDGLIYFENFTTIQKVSETGGNPEPVTRLDLSRKEFRHGFPDVTPDGKWLLLTVYTGWGWDEMQIEALSLATGARHVVARGGEKARFVAPGYVVYHRGAKDELFAIPVDHRSLRPTGAAVPLGEHVRAQNFTPIYDVSASGTLAYVAGDPRGAERRLVWKDRTGQQREELAVPPRPYMDARLSPDGRTAVLQIRESNTELWLHSLSRPGLVPFTRGGTSIFPVWSHDGRRIAFTGIRNGLWGIYAKSVDGTDQETELLAGSEGRRVLPGAWTSDGRLVIQIMEAQGPTSDLWLLDPGSGKLVTLADLPSSWEFGPSLSPNNQWLAFGSDLSRIHAVESFHD